MIKEQQGAVITGCTEAKSIQAEDAEKPHKDFFEYLECAKMYL